MDTNVKEFHKELNALLKLLESKARGDRELGLVVGIQTKLTIARSASYEHIVVAGVDMFYQYNDDITNRNEDLLLGADTTALLQDSAASDAKMYAELINLVRAVYKRSGAADRASAWDRLEKMRDHCFKYQLTL